VKTRTVYVTQYDVWWSFALRDWIRFVLNRAIPDLLGGQGYALPNDARIVHRPGGVCRVCPGGREFYSRLPGVIVVQPLNWTVDQWLEHVKELML
jgi:hypothetical protein